MKKVVKILLIIIFFAVVILFASKSRPAPNLEKYADEVLAKCQTEKYRPGCYDEEIPRLMDNISMEDAFKVTSIVQKEDKTYTYCHVLGHKLAAREIAKDPSKWKETVTRCPSGICSNGCIHGGFQERFRSENFTDEQIQQLKPDLIDLCEQRANWHPTGLEQASCYHALGHLTMYLTSADINYATILCEEIGLKKDGRDFSQLCFDGSFMQIYQPLEPEDFSLIYGKEVKKDTVDSFCAQFEGKRKASCLSESWPLFGSEIQKPQGLVKFCSKEEPGEQDRCFEGMLYVLTAQFNFDSQKIHNFCLGLPNARQAKCFANSASRMIETDYRNINKSVELCSSSQTDANKDVCFEELVKYSTYNFHAGSEQFYQLCNGLPESWKTKCLANSTAPKEIQVLGKTKFKYPQDYTIVLVGDSMTEYLGNSDELRAYLKKFYPDKTFEVLNYGFGSTNILSVQKRLHEETFYGRVFRPILDIDFDLIIIESFGHNPLSEFPLTNGLSKQNSALDQIVKDIQKSSPRAKIVFLATIAPNTKVYGTGEVDLSDEKRETWARERIAYIKNHIKYGNGHNIGVINVYEKSLDESGNGNTDYINNTDFIHPSPKGVYLISESIAKFLFENKIF